MNDFELGNMYHIDDKNIDDGLDLDDEFDDLDDGLWLDGEDIGDDFMLRKRYQEELDYRDRDHGFGGRDDDGFRGLDAEEDYGYTPGLDDEEAASLLMPSEPCDLDDFDR